ncbi:DUF1090 domain-containing protein [Erwinia psidii]|uniref:DUF1090 domain-containing protein n=1 Tax=Erwinia psidii TaxID=69224 RepID=A0A3N6TS50_9GAMM|nr:DUF1090 domain-containing protein [Erwinia psidii]MCX8958197.1 DUF1090 domain-containing protein [Erwinia psidii]MCX8963124.1 DUF1090 domain-containing protein [Erwinia psidii]MCX8966934.1 DUF1090 domain-containing protein [Erwinia psidii]RQM38072.1 DUF1090 domain-containing protein [Erwinia psidii]
MKYRTIPGFILLSLSSFSQAADSLCMQKEQDIQHEIAIAHQHNNQRRVNGLERALTQARADCSDEKLKTIHQQKIKQHQQKVAERQKELDQEKAEGNDSKKIAKREEKLAEAKHELQEVLSAPY